MADIEEQYFEDHVQHFMRAQTGSEDMVTDWIIVCATVDPVTGEPSGFSYSANAASADYVRLGLLESAVGDIKNLALIHAMNQSRRKRPRSDEG
ncbi:MAG: hypothetical protein RL431_153 [Actinomycetota bacterium]|jgi:hypothetical protein